MGVNRALIRSVVNQIAVAPAIVKRKTIKSTTKCIATGLVAAFSLVGLVKMGQSETSAAAKAVPEKSRPAFTNGTETVSRVKSFGFGPGC